jgi:hypothetical protein
MLAALSPWILPNVNESYIPSYPKICHITGLWNLTILSSTVLLLCSHTGFMSQYFLSCLYSRISVLQRNMWSLWTTREREEFSNVNICSGAFCISEGQSKSDETNINQSINQSTIRETRQQASVPIRHKIYSDLKKLPLQTVLSL